MGIVIKYIKYRIYKPLNGLVLWLHKRRYFGAFRFWLVRKIYKFIPGWPPARNLRFDFILKYIPKLDMVYWMNLTVLDIGCVDSLLVYELKRRGYCTFGMDIRPYQSTLPKNINFIKGSILEDPPERYHKYFYYVIATSVIELVGIGEYKEEDKEYPDRIALENIHKILKDEGYFILSLPIWNWRARDGRGYSLGDVYQLIKGLFAVFYITQECGMICLVLVKIINNGKSASLACHNKQKGM